MLKVIRPMSGTMSSGCPRPAYGSQPSSIEAAWPVTIPENLAMWRCTKTGCMIRRRKSHDSPSLATSGLPNAGFSKAVVTAPLRV